jgi:CheY-like chemotaxis protein
MMTLKNFKFLEGMLFQIVCKLIKATNGIETLSIFTKTTVYIVLLDVIMPDMDGSRSVIS